MNTPVEKFGENENPNPYENTDENLENDKKEEITEEKMEKRRTTVVFDTETTIPSEGIFWIHPISALKPFLTVN